MTRYRLLFSFALLCATLATSLASAEWGGISRAHAVTPANPNDNVQITLSPTKQRLAITAGQSTTGSFTIRNTGPLGFSFRIYASPYSVKSDADYTPLFTNDTPRTQISRWVTFTKTDYTLAPGESVDIPYRVRVPATIPAGSQYAAIFAETNGQNAGSVITKKRVGMLLYAKPNGTTKSSGDAQFTSIPPVIFGALVHSTAKVNNTGNTDFDTTVRLEQKSIFGGNNQSIEQVRTVLPETTRTVSLSTRSLTPIAAYTVTQSATVNGTVLSKTTTVYVISPLVAFFVAAFLLIIIALGVWRVVTKYRKKKQSSTR